MSGPGEHTTEQATLSRGWRQGSAQMTGHEWDPVICQWPITLWGPAEGITPFPQSVCLVNLGSMIKF